MQIPRQLIYLNRSGRAVTRPAANACVISLMARRSGTGIYDSATDGRFGHRRLSQVSSAIPTDLDASSPPPKTTEHSSGKCQRTMERAKGQPMRNVSDSSAAARATANRTGGQAAVTESAAEPQLAGNTSEYALHSIPISQITCQTQGSGSARHPDVSCRKPQASVRSALRPKSTNSHCSGRLSSVLRLAESWTRIEVISD